MRWWWSSSGGWVGPLHFRRHSLNRGLHIGLTSLHLEWCVWDGFMVPVFLWYRSCIFTHGRAAKTDGSLSSSLLIIVSYRGKHYQGSRFHISGSIYWFPFLQLA